MHSDFATLTAIKDSLSCKHGKWFSFCCIAFIFPSPYLSSVGPHGTLYWWVEFVLLKSCFPPPGGFSFSFPRQANTEVLESLLETLSGTKQFVVLAPIFPWLEFPKAFFGFKGGEQEWWKETCLEMPSLPAARLCVVVYQFARQDQRLRSFDSPIRGVSRTSPLSLWANKQEHAFLSRLSLFLSLLFLLRVFLALALGVRAFCQHRQVEFLTWEKCFLSCLGRGLMQKVCR